MDNVEKSESNVNNNTGNKADECASTDKTVSSKIEAWFRKTFPYGFKDELKALFNLAWPAGLATFFAIFMSMVSLMFCGHLGTEELDAVGLSISLLNITGVSVIFGLSTACDTLFSQAVGGNKKQLLGIYVQRSLMVMSLCVVLCWCIHLNTEGILILLGQNRTVARLAGVYVYYFMPGLLFLCIFQVFVRYLQNLNRILPTVWFGVIGNVVNVVAQYIGIYVIDGGLIGSSLALVLSIFVMLLTAIGYIFFTGLYKDSWGGWSIQSLERWGEFTGLALAGLFMTGIEWWCFEAGIFMNGLIGKTELGATSVLFQINQLVFMFPYGIAVASCIRIGQSLGASNAKATMTTARAAQVFAFFSFLLVATLLMSLRTVLPRLFTSDREVIDLVISIIPILVWMAFLDCIIATSMGTLRGCGNQWLGAAINFLGYILIAIPLCAVFLFVLRIGASGMWWGLIAGISVADCVYLYILMFRINWDDQVKKTQNRLSEKSDVKDDERLPLFPSERGNGYGYKGANDADINSTKLDDRSRNKKRRILIAKRLAACIIVFGILTAGVCVRLFVPLPAEMPVSLSLPLNNTLSFTNMTIQY